MISENQKVCINKLKETDNFSSKLEKGLNPQQRKVVENLNGNMLVIAGAGAGKTRMVTFSVAQLLNAGVKHNEILLLTFTKDASKEMIQRVNKFLGYSPSINSGTFHGIANSLFCREFISLEGESKDYEILSEKEQNAFLSKMLNNIIKEESNRRKREKYGSEFVSNAIYYQIWSEVKTEFPTLSELKSIFSGSINWEKSIKDMIEWKFPSYKKKIEEIQRIHSVYIQEKKLENKKDFDDLIVFWYKLLNYLVVKNHAKRFKYILIDEYQDTNIIQNKIIERINKLNPKLILAVGDDAQSIYAFRGANFRNILDFEANFKAKRFEITYNYRSSPEILNLANAIIKKNEKQIHKKMIPTKPSSKKPKYVVFNQKDQQMTWIYKKIRKLYNKGISYNEIAVLFRSLKGKKISESIDNFYKMLVKNNIKYELQGGLGFWDKSHILDILNIFDYRWRQEGSVAGQYFERVATNYISEFNKNMGLLLHDHILQKSNNALFILRTRGELKRRIDDFNRKTKQQQIKISSACLNNIERFFNLISDLKGKNFGEQIESLFQDEFFNSRFRNNYIGEGTKNNLKEKFDDISILVDICKDFRSYKEFYRELTFGDEINLEKEDEIKYNKITISTIHKAKGLEWKVVFIPFLEKDYLPSYYTLKTGKKEDLEEERRVFYVAVTRAKERLYLTASTERSGESLFIKELDKNLFDYRNY